MSILPTSFFVKKYYDPTVVPLIVNQVTVVKKFPWVIDDGFYFRLRPNFMTEIYERNDVYALDFFKPFITDQRWFTQSLIRIPDQSRYQFKYSILDYAQQDVLQVLDGMQIPVRGTQIPLQQVQPVYGLYIT
jgi:hypothetical protein